MDIRHRVAFSLEQVVIIRFRVTEANHINIDSQMLIVSN